MMPFLITIKCSSSSSVFRVYIRTLCCYYILLLYKTRRERENFCIAYRHGTLLKRIIIIFNSLNSPHILRYGSWRCAPCNYYVFASWFIDFLAPHLCIYIPTPAHTHRFHNVFSESIHILLLYMWTLKFIELKMDLCVFAWMRQAPKRLSFAINLLRGFPSKPANIGFHQMKIFIFIQF